MSRTLVSELIADAGTSRLPAAVATGLVIALLVVAVQTSIASIIFSGPLAPWVAHAEGAVLVGSAILCIVTALLGSYPGTISVPQFPVAAVLVTISAALTTRMEADSGEAMAATMYMVLILSAAATGFCFLLIGWFRLSNLLRFMPYPLIGGFLAGLGWVLAVSGIKMASGIDLSLRDLPQLFDPGIAWRWIPGVAYALLMFAITVRWHHYLIVPVSVVAGIILYNGVLLALGISSGEARDSGILFVGLPENGSWPAFGTRMLGMVDWSVVASQTPGILSVVLITLMCIILNGDALELGSGSKIDMDREFCAEGAGCLLAGIGPSVPGCNAVHLSLMGRSTGAETRFTGVVIALAIVCLLLFGGELLGTLPMPLLGGLVIYLGLGLIRDWVFVVRKSIPASDYAIVLFVSLVICVFGFVEGVAAGLACAVVMFVIHYSRLDVISASFTGNQWRSSRRRPAIHRAILRKQGDRVCVYRLRGFVIFGNAAPMGERVLDALKQEPRPICLVIDFTGVSGFDVSAANVISRCIRAATAQDTRVVMCSMTARAQGVVQRILGEGEWRNLDFVDDFESGMEKCEDLVVAAWQSAYSDSTGAQGLFAASVDDAMSQLEMDVRFEELIDRLNPWVEESAHAPGQAIIARGELVDGMHLLVEGTAYAFDRDSGIRVDEYNVGDALMPEAAIGSFAARLTISAIEPCRTVVMTVEGRKTLECEDPALALELDRYLIEAMARLHRGQDSGRVDEMQD